MRILSEILKDSYEQWINLYFFTNLLMMKLKHTIYECIEKSGCKKGHVLEILT